MTDWAGRIALVTGAASGIGAAVAARLTAAGATVIGADLNESGARTATGDAHRAVGLDVRDESSWLRVVDGIVSAHGRLDLLVNCVGVAAGSPITETTIEEWRLVLSTNLDGAFLGTKHAIRAMKTTGGAIIHIGSASGIRAAAGAAAYSASKAGLAMLVRAAAKECRDAGLKIRINLVSPAGVKTPMWSSMPFFQDLARNLGTEEAAYASMAGAGGGRFIDPDAVAQAVCFLAGPGAEHITGVELPVDAGYIL